jgi:hypothetical protein
VAAVLATPSPTILENLLSPLSSAEVYPDIAPYAATNPIGPVTRPSAKPAANAGNSFFAALNNRRPMLIAGCSGLEVGIVISI